MTFNNAGYHKDPILAQGISDAFRDAELLVEAIDAGCSGQLPMDAALATYEQHRNAAALPAYEANLAAASCTPPPPEVFAQRAALRAAAPVGTARVLVANER